MLEIKDDLWAIHAMGHYICITTNGTVKKDGSCVMGRGCAREAADRFPDLPFLIGEHIKEYGNCIFIDEERKIFTFPVKYNFWEKADINLIKVSCYNLIELLDNHYRDIQMVYLPRPGCGFGSLEWSKVKEAISDILDDRVTIISPKGKW